MWNFSYPEQFYFIALFCSNFYAQDSFRKQSYGLNSAKSPSNFNSLTFLYIINAFLESFRKI